MKNLFKSMMLVAVAAMGMVACQNEPETVIPGNENLEKATIEVIADLETTRSAFGNKDGNFYPSYWQGGEQVEASTSIVKTLAGYNFLDGSQSSATVNVAEGETIAKFSLSFSSSPTDGTTIYLATPGASVSVDEYGIVTAIPTTQTPLESSVDPLAHILTATYTGPYTTGTIKPEWEHAAAYAKMTLKNIENVERVVVTIDSKSYQLNADKVVGNVFWFACEANEAPSTVKVTVNTTDDKTYKKTLDLVNGGNGSGLSFVKGQVAEFAVNMDGITPEEGGADVGSSLDFTGAYMWDTIAWNASGYFKITSSTNAHGSSSYVYIYLNEADRPNNNSIKPGTYTAATNDKTPDVGYFCARVGASGSAAFWTMYESGLPAGATLVVNYYDGKYQILFTKSATESHGYEGFTEGWDAPATGGGEEPEPEPEPVQLAAPTNLSATATADTATVTWTAVDNASSYDVTVGTTTKNVTTTTATFEGLTPETTYDVSVVAVGDGTNYTTSPAATTTVTTEASATPEPEPEPDGAIVFSSCTYLENVYGMLKHYKFVSADGQNVIHVFMNSNNSGTATAYIPVGDYTNDSMNNTAQKSTYFNMDCNVGGFVITDTKINGVVYANGISTDAANTMKVTEAADGGNHVIEFVIKGTTFRFTGTIQ